MEGDDAEGTAVPEIRRLLREWMHAIRIIHVAHTQTAVAFAKRARGLGLAVTILAAVMGSSLFAAGAGGGTNGTIAFAGILAAAAAILSAAQTYLDYPTLAAQHGAASREFGILRRELESTLVVTAPEGLPALLATVRTRWSEIETNYPMVPERRYRAAQRLVVSSLRGGSRKDTAEPANGRPV